MIPKAWKIALHLVIDIPLAVLLLAALLPNRYEHRISFPDVELACWDSVAVCRQFGLSESGGFCKISYEPQGFPLDWAFDGEQSVQFSLQQYARNDSTTSFLLQVCEPIKTQVLFEARKDDVGSSVYLSGIYAFPQQRFWGLFYGKHIESYFLSHDKPVANLCKE